MNMYDFEKDYQTMLSLLSAHDSGESIDMFKLDTICANLLDHIVYGGTEPNHFNRQELNRACYIVTIGDDHDFVDYDYDDLEY